MDEIIENLRNEKCKLERDLKTKNNMVADLSNENDQLHSVLETTKKHLSDYEEMNGILQTRLKNVENTLDDIHDNYKRRLYNEEKKHLETCQELSKLKTENEGLTFQVENMKNIPQVDVEKIEQNYISEIEYYNVCISQLVKDLEVQKQKDQQLQKSLMHEKEVSMANNNRLKEELRESINKIEQLQLNYVELQAEKDQANFAKQGNTLYAEVDDRRVLAESKLKELQSHLDKQAQINLNLRIYLENSFQAYSGLVDENYRQKRAELEKEINRLRRMNTALNILNQEMVEKMQTNDGKSTDASLRLENTILQHKLKLCDKELSQARSDIDSVTKEKKRFFNDLKLQTEKSIASERDKSEKIIHLDILKTLVTNDVLDVFNRELKKLEQKQHKSEQDNVLFTSAENQLAFPNINQDSTNLVFDVYGNLACNKLTQRICDNITKATATTTTQNNLPNDNTETKEPYSPFQEKPSSPPPQQEQVNSSQSEPIKYSTHDDDDDDDESAAKENLEPRNLFNEAIEPIKLSDENVDCRTS